MREPYRDRAVLDLTDPPLRIRAPASVNILTEQAFEIGDQDEGKIEQVDGEPRMPKTGKPRYADAAYPLISS